MKKKKFYRLMTPEEIEETRVLQEKETLGK